MPGAPTASATRRPACSGACRSTRSCTSTCIGTVLLPLIAAVSNFPIIGWAKPVPVNISRLRHPRRDFMIVAAAGPASNILLAVLAAVLVQVLPLALGRSVDRLDLD